MLAALPFLCFAIFDPAKTSLTLIDIVDSSLIRRRRSFCFFVSRQNAKPFVVLKDQPNLLRPSRENRRRQSHWHLLALVSAILLHAGCGSTTQRTATEQLLLSEAVDNSINQIDFSPLQDMKVYLDTAALRPVQGQGIVGGDYVASVLRQKMLAARCLLKQDRSDAEVIVEARIGALATNGHDVVYGIPASNGVSALSSALPNTPAVPPLPELSVGRSNVLAGMSKVAVFAYDKQTNEAIWQSGSSRSETNARATWVLGVGPYVRGNIFDRPRFAGSALPQKAPHSTPVFDRIPLKSPYVFSRRQPEFEDEQTGPEVRSAASDNLDQGDSSGKAIRRP